MKYLILALSYLLLAVPCSAEIIIVDDDWPYDFNNIQAAIDYSTNGDTIYVFPGTYTGPGNWDIDFNSRAVTVQSVDPLNPYIVAATVIDCNDVNYHAGFVFDGGEDANSVLAGFTVTNARGAIRCYNSSPSIINCTITNNGGSPGGGISCTNSSPTITNCDITQNIGSSGGGIHCYNHSHPVITGCIITANTSIHNGGGIHCDNESNPIISDSDISHNTSVREGGGIYCRGDASITINNCTIIGNSTNSAVYPGGGIYCDSGDLTIHNSIITANTAEFGGGIYHIGGGKLTITGSTIAANAATVDTGGIYCFAGMASLTNSILWANTDSGPTDLSAQIFGDPPEVLYSCIQDGNPNDGYVPFGAGDPNYNIDDDPCFVGYPDDFNDLHLQFNSPCIEAGLPNYIVGPNVLDIDGQPRIIGRQVDIGADEYGKIIIVTKPTGGEIWTAGSSHQINWESYGVTGNGNVDIFGFDNSIIQILPIADNVPDTGTFTWNLPGSVDSNQLQVHVFPHNIDITVTIVPSGLFTIKPYSPGPPIATKWKSLGGDFDRAGLSAHFGPEIGCIKWQFQTSAPVSASVTVADNNTVHIACEDGNLYTLDANDGSLLWTFEVNSPLLSSPSIGLDGTVYVGAQNGTLYAIDVNGDLQWTHPTASFIYSSPAVSPDGNNIYACSQDGSLYALARDGSELWTFQTAGPGIATGAIFASPAVGPDGTVYIAGVYDPNLYALDPDTGSVIWDCNFLDPCDPNAEKPWPFASPVVAPDGTIYQALLYNPKRDIGGEPGNRDYQLIYEAMFYAIDPNDGNTIWSTNVSDTRSYPNEPEWSEPNWFRPYYVDTREDGFYFSPHPYKQIFRSQIRYYRVSRDCWSEPAIGPDGTIYVNFEDQYIRALDPNGTIKWVTSLGWLGGFNLTVGIDGLIYAAGDDGYLYVLDHDGHEIARYQTDNRLSFPVITQDGTIIVNDANNMVTAIIDDDCPGQPPALHRPEDLNTDWQMNFIDFDILAADWLNCSDTTLDPQVDGDDPLCDYDGNDVFLAGDINRDQYVDAFDLAQLAMRWLAQD